MSEDSYLGKSLKCFEIYCEGNNMIVEIVKEEINCTEILDPTINTNTLALRICNKYDIPFILIKNEIEIKKKEFFSKKSKIEVLREELKPDYQILCSSTGLVNNKSAFLVFNNNVKLNNTIDAKKQKSLEMKGSIHTTKMNTFSKTSLYDNAKSMNINTEKHSKNEVMKVNKSNNDKISNVKRIIVKSNDKTINTNSKKNSLFSYQKPLRNSKVLKINLNDPFTSRTPEKKMIRNISDRDLLVNRIYNSKYVGNQTDSQRKDKKLIKDSSNSSRKFQFYTPVKQKSNLSKDDLSKNYKSPVIKQSRSFVNKNSLGANLIEKKANNENKAKKTQKKQVSAHPQKEKRPGNNSKKDDIVKKILSYIFIELDKDTDNKISINDFIEENSLSHAIRLFLPVKGRLLENEGITKEVFISFCEEIYMNFSRMDKISLIDWYLDKKSHFVKESTSEVLFVVQDFILYLNSYQYYIKN